MTCEGAAGVSQQIPNAPSSTSIISPRTGTPSSKHGSIEKIIRRTASKPIPSSLLGPISGAAPVVYLNLGDGREVDNYYLPERICGASLFAAFRATQPMNTPTRSARKNIETIVPTFVNTDQISAITGTLGTIFWSSLSGILIKMGGGVVARERNRHPNRPRSRDQTSCSRHRLRRARVLAILGRPRRLRARPRRGPRPFNAQVLIGTSITRPSNTQSSPTRRGASTPPSWMQRSRAWRLASLESWGIVRPFARCHQYWNYGSTYHDR